MTFRAKPVVKRDHRPAWEAQDRRNFYLNLGFGLIVLLAVLILGIAVALVVLQRSPRVGRQRRRPVDQQGRPQGARHDSRTSGSRSRRRRIDTAVLAGHLTAEQGDAAKQTIEQQRQQLAQIALERIIDTRLQAEAGRRRGRQCGTSRCRRPAAGRGHDARDPARLGDRGQAGHRSRRDRADGGPEGRGQGQRGDRAQGPPGREAVGRHRQDRVDRRDDRAAGRRPRLADRRRQPAGRAPAQGRLCRRRQHADGRHRGERWHLSDRPSERHPSRGGGRCLPGEDPERQDRPGAVPLGRRGRRHPREADVQDRR